MKILIKNIKSIVQFDQGDRLRVAGKDLQNLPCLSNAWIAIENDLIVAVGQMDHFPGIADWNGVHIIDATNKLVFPSWVDSHTHLVFAHTREEEFVSRIKGDSYEDIAKKGGGILNSASKLNQMSEDDLFHQALKRLNKLIQYGTGAIEIKSGYGLTVEGELKMLRVIKRLKENSPLAIKSTFLGAHAIPSIFKNDKNGYIKLLLNELIPEIAKESLADYCDVFCEQNYFSKAETNLILSHALANGMKARVHAEQMSWSGGVEAGVACNALSVDHLEYLSTNDIELLRHSKTMPTLLPGAQFFLQLSTPPVRAMIEAGLPIAIASDYNPGSCPNGNMNLMIALACVLYKITPEEAINAATINTAYALELSHQYGSIAVGKKASLFVTKEQDGYSLIPYSLGENAIDTVILNGIIQNLSV